MTGTRIGATPVFADVEPDSLDGDLRMLQPEVDERDRFHAHDPILAYWHRWTTRANGPRVRGSRTTQGEGGEMAEFRVVIEGLTLDAKATKAINDSIQRVVLDQLAGFDLTTKKQAVVAFRPHPDWYGLVAQVLKRADVVALPPVNKTIKGLGGPDT